MKDAAKSTPGSWQFATHVWRYVHTITIQYSAGICPINLHIGWIPAHNKVEET
ncbi:hypothetical protein BDU57DRAFT_512824 [Ampelomyces quisqualis]|uniref:Uncharacterized protein n=1 Tax=Ampelomyces quisqualis TaxID=50730 RepID=A0A6A5QXR0_AMPQU|nr:hypothetical protein BDU57DRAFT_512824 [Ampelomyces quisqualis]